MWGSCRISYIAQSQCGRAHQLVRHLSAGVCRNIVGLVHAVHDDWCRGDGSATSNGRWRTRVGLGRRW